MTTSIAYRIITKATDEKGQPVKFETFDRQRAVSRCDELRARDPRTRFVGIPVQGR